VTRTAATQTRLGYDQVRRPPFQVGRAYPWGAMQHRHWWAFWEERDEDDPHLIRGGLITLLLGPSGAVCAAVHTWRRGQHRIGGAFGVLGALWVVVAALIVVPLVVGSAVPSCSGVYALRRGIAPAGDSGQWVKLNLHLQTSITGLVLQRCLVRMLTQPAPAVGGGRRRLAAVLVAQPGERRAGVPGDAGKDHVQELPDLRHAETGGFFPPTVAARP